MRSFLSGFGSKKSNESQEEASTRPRPTSPTDSPENKRMSGTSSMFSSFFGKNSNIGDSPDSDKVRRGDITAQWIHSASSTLSESIDEILGDSAALSSEQMKGFRRLISVLENDEIEIHTDETSSPNTPTKGYGYEEEEEEDDHEEINRGERDTGEGCIQVLLDNISHPRFVEICNGNNLVVSLVHAMRLLKIMEIKVAKIVASALHEDGSPIAGSTVKPDQLETARALMGSTLESAQRACALLEALCCDPNTMELLNSHKSLEKLLTYPMTSVPGKALHLQTLVAKVVSMMTRLPLSSEQVWLLHESNSVPLMVRNLKELAADPVGEEGIGVSSSSGSKQAAGGKGEAERASKVLSPSGSVSADVPSPSAWSPINSNDGDTDRSSESGRVSFGRLSEGRKLGSPSDSYNSNNNTKDARGGLVNTKSLGGGQEEKQGRQQEKGAGGNEDDDAAPPASLSIGCTMLKGSAAEAVGMWVCGINAIIDVLSSSLYVNPVLLNDFESAGGYKLLVHILSSSSQLHFMNGLIGVTRLLCDPVKGPEEPIADLTAGAVILEVLVALLQIDEGLEALPPPPHALTSRSDSPLPPSAAPAEFSYGGGGASAGNSIDAAARRAGATSPTGSSPGSAGAGDTPGGSSSAGALGSETPLASAFAAAASNNNINKLARMSYTIYIHHQQGQLPPEWQSAVQSVAYTLLTLYSNQPKNCLALESAYHYLTLLMLTLPALALGDGNAVDGSVDGAYTEVISAVLTTLDYVCNCVSEATPLPLTALSAATSVCAKLMLHTPSPGQAGNINTAFEGWASLISPTPQSSSSTSSTSNAEVSPLYPMGYSPRQDSHIDSAFGTSSTNGGPSTPGGGDNAAVSLARGTVFNPGPGMNSTHMRGLLKALGLVVECYAGICRLRSMYTALLVQGGILTNLHCAVFEHLHLSLPSNQPPGDASVNTAAVLIPSHQGAVYGLLLDLLLVLLRNSTQQRQLQQQQHRAYAASDADGDVASELRSLGLTVILRNLVRHRCIGPELTRHLLLVAEVLAVDRTTSGDQRGGSSPDTSYLEESMQSLLDVLRQVRPALATSSASGASSSPSSFKVLLLLQSLRTMLQQNEQGARVWSSFSGYSDLMDTLGSFNAHFNSVEQLDDKELNTLLESTQAILECVVCELARDNGSDVERVRRCRSKALATARTMRQSGILSFKQGVLRPRAIALLLAAVCGFPTSADTVLAQLSAVEGSSGSVNASQVLSGLVAPIAFPEMALALIDLLPDLGADFSKVALHALHSCAQTSAGGYQQLSDAGLVGFVLKRYGALLCLSIGSDAVPDGLITKVSSKSDDLSVKEMLLGLMETLLCHHMRTSDLVLLISHFAREAASDPDSLGYSNLGSEAYEKSREGEEEEEEGGEDDDERQFVEQSGPRLLLPAASGSGNGPSGVSAWAIRLISRLALAHADKACYELSTPHIAFGDNSDGYVEVALPPVTASKVLTQQPGFTYIGWVRFDCGGERGDGKVGALPVLSLSVVGEDMSCEGSSSSNNNDTFLEVLLLPGWGTGPAGKERIVVYASGSSAAASKSGKKGSATGAGKLHMLTFGCPAGMSLHAQRWHQLAVTVLPRRKGRYQHAGGTAAAPNLVLLMNGVQCPLDSSEDWAASFEVSFPSSPALINPPAGTAAAAAAAETGSGAPDLPRGGNTDSTATTGPYLSMKVGASAVGLSEYQPRLYVLPQWCLGPTLLYDCPLSSQQIAYTYLVGPEYSGVQPASHLAVRDAPLHDQVVSISAGLITRCLRDSGEGDGGDVVAYTRALGLAGLERVVDPCLERSCYTTSTMNIPHIPAAALEYNPRLVVTRYVGPPLKSQDGSNIKTHSLATRAGAVNIMSLPNLSGHGSTAPMAVVKHSSSPDSSSVDSARKVCAPHRFSTVMEALGGPSVLLPLVQAASTPALLADALALLRFSLSCSTVNLKHMHAGGGYKALAFVLYCKPVATLDNDLVMREVFAFGTSTARGHGGLCITDTMAIHHLTLNHLLWRAEHFAQAQRAVLHLHALATDRVYGQLNCAKLGALGVARWALMLLWHGVHGGRAKESKVDTDSKGDAVKTGAGAGAEADGREWRYQAFEDLPTSEGQGDGDSFLNSMCALVRDVMCVEVRRKDVDLAASLILHSFSVSRPLYVDSSSGSVSPREFLTASSITRYHLLKLLFSLVVDLHTNPEYQLSLPVTHTGNAPCSHKEAEAAEAGSAASGSAGHEQRRKQRLTTTAQLRASLNPDWFLCVLERVSDSSTFTQALRLLVLHIQQDSQFAAAFYAARGWPALRAILCCRPQPLSVVLPLVALLFGIPVTMMPTAHHLQTGGWSGEAVVTKVASLLSLEQVSGPPLAPETLTTITHPVFAILVEVVTVHVAAAACSPGPSVSFASPSSPSAAASSSEASRDAPAGPISPVTELFLGLLLHASAPPANSAELSVSLKAIRALLQAHLSIAALTGALASCSSLCIEVDGGGVTRVLATGGAGSSGAGIDLSALVTDDYVAGGTACGDSNNNNCARTTDWEGGRHRASLLRFIDDEPGFRGGLSPEDEDDSNMEMSPVGWEGVALESIIQNLAKSALLSTEEPSQIDLIAIDGDSDGIGASAVPQHAASTGTVERLQAAGQSNLAILAALLTSYPTHLPQRRYRAYQERMCGMLVEVLSILCGVNIATTVSIGIASREMAVWERISDSLTLLIPLCEEGHVGESVLSVLLELVSALLSRLRLPLTDTPESLVSQSEKDRQRTTLQRLALYRDVCLMGRYLTGVVLRGVGSTDDSMNSGNTPKNKQQHQQRDRSPSLSDGGGSSSSTSQRNRSKDRGQAITKVRGLLLPLLLEPRQALDVSETGTQAAAAAAGGVSYYGDSVHYLAAARGTQDKLKGKSDGGSTSTYGAFRDRFARRNNSSSNSGSNKGSDDNPSSNNNNNNNSNSSSSTWFGGLTRGSSSLGDIPTVPTARDVGPALSRLLQLASADKWAASIQFLPSLLYWCQERLLDDNDTARKESAWIMALIFSRKPGYATNLLCRPLRLPLPPYADMSSNSVYSGGGGGGVSRHRGSSLDEDAAAAIASAIAGEAIETANPGNYHAIVSRNAHARKSRLSGAGNAIVPDTSRDTGERDSTASTGSRGYGASSPVEIYAGYDPATLLSIYGVPEDQMAQATRSMVAQAGSGGDAAADGDDADALLPQGFYAQGLSILATAIADDDEATLTAVSVSMDHGNPTGDMQVKQGEQDARLAAYSFWLTDGSNGLRVARLFEHLDRAVGVHKDMYLHTRGQANTSFGSAAGSGSSSSSSYTGTGAEMSFWSDNSYNGVSMWESAAQLRTPDALTCGNGMSLGPSRGQLGLLSGGNKAALGAFGGSPSGGLRATSPPSVGGIILSPSESLEAATAGSRGHNVDNTGGSSGGGSSAGNGVGAGATASGAAGAAASDFLSRAEDGQRRGEAATGVHRRWCLSYYALLSRGASVWQVTWTRLQSAGLWGHEPPLCLPATRLTRQLLDCPLSLSSAESDDEEGDNVLVPLDTDGDDCTERDLRLARRGVASKGLYRPYVKRSVATPQGYLIQLQHLKKTLSNSKGGKTNSRRPGSVLVLPKVYRLSLLTEGCERSRRLMRPDYVVPLRLKIDLPRTQKEREDLLQAGKTARSANASAKQQAAAGGGSTDSPTDVAADRRLSARKSKRLSRSRGGSTASTNTGTGTMEDTEGGDDGAAVAATIAAGQDDQGGDPSLARNSTCDSPDGGTSSLLSMNSLDSGSPDVAVLPQADDMQSFLKHASRAGYLRRMSASRLDQSMLRPVDDHDHDDHDHDDPDVAPVGAATTDSGGGGGGVESAAAAVASEGTSSEPNSTNEGGSSAVATDTDTAAQIESQGVQVEANASSSPTFPPVPIDISSGSGDITTGAGMNNMMASERESIDGGMESENESEHSITAIAAVTSTSDVAADRAATPPPAPTAEDEQQQQNTSQVVGTPPPSSSSPSSAGNVPGTVEPASQVKRRLTKEKRRRDLAHQRTAEWRSSIVGEMVRGLVGAQEWGRARVYNVDLICGLELMPALLVMCVSTTVPATRGSTSADSSGAAALAADSSAKLHVLVGFRAKRAGEDYSKNARADAEDTPMLGSECYVEWAGLAPRTTKTETGGDENDVQGVSRWADLYSLSWRAGSYYTALQAYHGGNTAATAAIADAAAMSMSSPALPSDLLDSDHAWCSAIWNDLLSPSCTGHLVMHSDEIYTLFKRRHQLKYSALEISDTRGSVFLFSCQHEGLAEHLLGELLDLPLPSSIFRKALGYNRRGMRIMARGLDATYSRLVSRLIAAAGKLWESGRLTNFEYLMHLNAAAGRSYQDLTQYPVFPWVLADYTSSQLDLHDPAVYRDLSKPMGALGSGRRAEQFRERYASLDELYRDEEGLSYDSDSDSASVASSSGPGSITSTPAFFYGTHYSCAGYVLHYLCRMQPFADMSVALQGGRFDQPDRLFLDIAASWRSASQDNLQDVRELIPEFYYCPEFLVNRSNLDLGVTQKGDIVGDVKLPPWAHGSSYLFVRKHREALESKYVSEHLNHWIDLIFGHKQRGQGAIDAMNVFIHLTYEGEVDIDAIDDPVLKMATISQINNFGQCPSQLFGRPHKKRIVPLGGPRPRPHSLASLESVPRPSSSAAGLNLTADFEEESEGATAKIMTVASASTMSVTTLRHLASDSAALCWHEQLAAPFSVVGAPHVVQLVQVGKTEVYSMSPHHHHHHHHQHGFGTSAVGDFILFKNAVLACSADSVLLAPADYGRRALRFGSSRGGFSVLSPRSGLGGVNVSHALGMSGTSMGGSSGLVGGGGAGSSGLGTLSGALSSMMMSSSSSSNSNTSGSGGNGSNTADHDRLIAHAMHDFEHGAATAANVSHSLFLDADKEVHSVHEQLHIDGITCVCVDHPDSTGAGGVERATVDGHASKFVVTGGSDCAVKVWDLSWLLQHRKVRLHATLTGHSAPITCVDFCATFGGLVASGATDGTCCVWDVRSGQLVRELRNCRTDEGEEDCAVISVSISASTGHIVLATAVSLEMYSMSGWLLAKLEVAGARFGNRLTVVRAVPVGEWQEEDGIVAVTGHESGAVQLWRLSSVGAASGMDPITGSTAQKLVSAYHVPCHQHRSPITALRVVAGGPPTYHESSAGQAMGTAAALLGRGKEVVERCHSPAGGYELLVGDRNGTVSRWHVPRLESLLPPVDGKKDKRGRDGAAPGVPAGDILRYL